MYNLWLRMNDTKTEHSRVKDAVNALLAARELSFIHVSGRSMLQITPAKEPVVATARPHRAAK
ncbi:MAG TPA: hypothetical protein VNX26_08805 [Candidatus Acidoferrum sp.]|jgi:hypothetical protein|nr:hypothetical protein [Candidatus Acidoferrum sp.]